MSTKHYVAAISGGVDSVALLDMLASAGYKTVVVAHFDHGIRPDSHLDARFVGTLASKYGYPYVTERAELGLAASEAEARSARYDFLRRVAKDAGGVIVTAHHKDDVVETILINLERGTGWRGLGVMGATDIVRPLLGMRKGEIQDYAKKKGLSWREDSTNSDERYARNRIRATTGTSMSRPMHATIARLGAEQRELAKRIDAEVGALLDELSPDGEFARHDFIMIDHAVARELLGGAIRRARGHAPTRPQLERALHAIKTAAPGSDHHVGEGTRLVFTSRSFSVR